ncbi:ABC transporter permease [Lentibacillus saliphilus]|uniref:ABC transporter permease n=1 Tax=Lentibacillus saliphilus TaxID=2737028 RepID=UPI001C30C651|nr:ABC transporter permease [Lentibacillus saliphilus]
MIKLILFELKKLFKTKKLLYIIAIITLFNVYQYTYHATQADEMVDRLYEDTEPLMSAVNRIERDLGEKRANQQLGDMGLAQSDAVKEMKSDLQDLRSAIYSEEFGVAPKFEQAFLHSLQDYLNVGGEFTVLNWVGLDYALEKNAWMIEHDLAVEDETYPLSPHLFLTDSSEWLFGISGVILLVLILGNILSAEREQHTWFTLKTQPITKSHIILSKYMALMLSLLCYMLYTIIIGILIPLVFGDFELILNYPHVLVKGDEVVGISTLHYVSLKISLFVGAGLIALSFLLFISILFKSTFNTLMVSIFVLLSGYFLTDSIPAIQTPLNIFQHLRLDKILSETGSDAVWTYLLFAVVWSAVLIIMTLSLPEKSGRLIQFTTVRKSFHSGQTHPTKGRLWNVVVFEWRKLLRKGHMINVLTFTLIVIVGGYFFLHHAETKKETTYIDGLNQEVNGIQRELIPIFEESLAGYKAELEHADDDIYQEELHDYIEGHEEAIHLYQKQVAVIQKGIKGYESENWKPFYEQQLFRIKLFNGEFDEPLNHIGHSFTGMEFQSGVSLKKTKWLMERDIQPIFPGDYTLTIHDEWPGTPQGEIARADWEGQNHKVNASGLYSLFHFYEYYIYLALIVLFLFLLGTGMSSERGKQSTIHFLRTQPISGSTLFLGKVICSALVVTGIFLGVVLFIFLLGAIFNRLGDWNYPILHYDTLSESTAVDYTGFIADDQSYGFHFIPLGNYLLQCLILLFLAAVFVMVMANFLSLWAKNTTAVMTLTLIIVIGGYVGSIEYISEWAYLSPFTYLDIMKVANGALATQFDQSLINSYVGSVSLGVSALVLIALGYVKEKMKRKA